METAFTVLIIVQFLVVVAHDWLEIPGLTHGRQVQAAVGRRTLAIATAVNAIFPGIAVVLALWFWNAPKPWFATDYWVLYCAITVASAVFMWYLPYFFGAPQETRRRYAAMYAGTRQVLPARGDNPRPNLLHVCFHALFLLTLGMALVMRMR